MKKSWNIPSNSKDMHTTAYLFIFAAFCVTGAFMFGDFFGYVGAVNASMLLPMIIAKLSSGIVAMVIALWMSKGK